MNKPKTIKQAIDIVASLGGYINRENDPPPGHQILWKGYSILQYIKFGIMYAEQNNIESILDG